MLRRSLRMSPCGMPCHCSPARVLVGVIWQLERDIFDFLLTVKAAPHECVIRTGQP